MKTIILLIDGAFKSFFKEKQKNFSFFFANVFELFFITTKKWNFGIPILLLVGLSHSLLLLMLHVLLMLLGRRDVDHLWWWLLLLLAQKIMAHWHWATNPSVGVGQAHLLPLHKLLML
jgi:hypothetical protein